MNFYGENFKRILYGLGGGLAFRKKKCREYRERTLLSVEIIEKRMEGSGPCMWIWKVLNLNSLRM